MVVTSDSTVIASCRPGSRESTQVEVWGSECKKTRGPKELLDSVFLQYAPCLFMAVLPHFLGDAPHFETGEARVYIFSQGCIHRCRAGLPDSILPDHGPKRMSPPNA